MCVRAAELSSQLPRGLSKPAFAPELLEIAKQSISPAELAATMTLALAASTLDPATLASKQHQMAMTGSAAAALAAPLPGTPDLAHMTSAWSTLAGRSPGSTGAFHSPQAAAAQATSMAWPSLAGSLSGPTDAASISNLWSQFAGYGSNTAGGADPTNAFSFNVGSTANAWQQAAGVMGQHSMAAGHSYVPSRLGGDHAASAAMNTSLAAYTQSMAAMNPAASWGNLSAWTGGMAGAGMPGMPTASMSPMQPVHQQ